MNMLAHLRDLWGRYWFLPLVPLLFLPISATFGQMRVEIVIVVLVLVALGVATHQTKRFLIAAIPGIAIALGYEVVRFLRPVFITPDRVLGCNLRALDLMLFPAGDNLTWPDFFATHHAAFWDVVFAIPYTAFWGIAIVYSVLLYVIDRPGMTRYLWTLAAVHAVAFVIWLAFPAAPPWYIQAHGCDINLLAAPYAAGLTRIDALFGMHYFADFYRRAPTVFGAMPSLHCAFPMVGLVAAWRNAGPMQRSTHAAYALWMLAASVYLDHHWLLDGLTGVAIVLLVYVAIARFLPELDRAPADVNASA